MRPERPLPLRELERDQLHQLAGNPSENKTAARRTLREARSFQQLAQVGIESELSLPAVSNFHEAARLAVTAVATANGVRFRNTAGAHEAVVDYPDGTAIFVASEFVGETLPWLLLLAAIGSQTSAIIGATSSRSDMLVHHKVSRTLTFPIILVPAILLVLLVDINVAVNLASRVFAAYFTIQASLATLLAIRKRNWPAAAGFVVVALAMIVILVFGLPL